MAAMDSVETLPPSLDATAAQPALFDGTTRLYTCYSCPYAQRVWITRNYKGLQNEIKLVPLNLQNRPAWYKEKVYPKNQVPSLEHNGKVIGESLDLIKYVDSNFEGPSLLPTEPEKNKFGDELLAHVGTFGATVYASFKEDDGVTKADPEFAYLEAALDEFKDGPFLLGQFSLVDIAYIPLVERFQFFFAHFFNIDVTASRPNFARWIMEMNEIEAYKITKVNHEELVQFFQKRFLK